MLDLVGVLVVDDVVAFVVVVAVVVVLVVFVVVVVVVVVIVVVVEVVVVAAAGLYLTFEKLLGRLVTCCRLVTNEPILTGFTIVSYLGIRPSRNKFIL